MKRNIGKNSRIVLLSVMSLCYLACNNQPIKGSGSPATRQLELTGVRKIRINGIGEYFITHAQEEHLLIRADDNVLPHITSEINNDELFLIMDKNVHISAVTPLVFSISLKDISEINAKGSNNIEIKSLKTTRLNISLNGSSELKGNVIADDINITASGSTEVTLNGTADNQAFILKGSSLIDGTQLIGKNAMLNGRGSSSIKLNVTEKINGSISGAAEVYYKNNPTIELKTSGAASIKKL